jgi:hypothetical protein
MKHIRKNAKKLAKLAKNNDHSIHQGFISHTPFFHDNPAKGKTSIMVFLFFFVIHFKLKKKLQGRPETEEQQFESRCCICNQIACKLVYMKCQKI